MHGFFPNLPFYVPKTPGIAHWWDPVWWAVHMLIMGSILLVLKNWGQRHEKLLEEETDEKPSAPVGGARS